MVGRAWSLLAGSPLGALGAWAVAGAPTPQALGIGAALGGVSLAAIVWLLARVGDDEPERPAYLSAAASTGLAALPALAASALRWAPGPRWLFAAAVVALALALARAARARGPSGGLARQLAAVGVALAGGTVGVFALGAGVAAFGPGDPPFEEDRATAIYDLDAAVPTLPLPRCAAAPAEVEVLLDHGARPRAAPDGAAVWYDAPTPDGTRQVHRLELASRREVCWTCGEPGNNLRPSPGAPSAGIVFDTDRWATWREPRNTEIHVMRARGEAPTEPSRRLTHVPGSDDHAVFGSAARVVIWSQQWEGRYRVVSAAIRSAHGGLMLSPPTVLANGRSQWTLPLAWSPDARSLVVARGNPFRPLFARGIDFAEGTSERLGADVVPGGAAFNGDGGWLVTAHARRARPAGLLPVRLGGLLAALAARAEREGPLHRETALRAGEPRGEGAPLALGPVAGWGEPTGITWLRGRDAVVLGQRRVRDGVAEERLLRIRLDCTT